MSIPATRLPMRLFALLLMLAQLPLPAAAQSRSKKPGPDQIAESPVAKGRLFAVVLGPGTAWKKGQPFKGPGLEQHRAYWKKLHADGHVASAGPLGADTGLALVRARDQRQADALIAADPAVKAKLLRAVARPYSSELASAAVLAGR